MAHRRLTASEKGKGMDLENQEPARAARVKVPLPDNSELLRKHSLTLIGRVTNKTVQKVWSLIPFFTEHWKTEFKPVGSDLGNGLFQFQFELESDLLTVLEQRPYHYARWMVILQRWEPTISPTFPSLIPFWIKVQGLPVHLWTEDTVKYIGQDIGLFEKAEITSLSIRMRVHINGLLPLIKTSVVEYPNGDEVPTTLIYERLDKHCTKCLRLDHELKECLVAKAEAKVLKEAQEKILGRSLLNSDQAEGAERGAQIDTRHRSQSIREGDNKSGAAFQFSASHNEESQVHRRIREHKDHSYHRPYKSQTRVWQEKSSHRRSSQARERSGFEYERASRPPRENLSQRNLPGPPSGSYYREVARKNADNRDTGSSAPKANYKDSEREIPQQTNPQLIPQEVLNEARGELRDVMLLYTKCADPIEREARMERFRQAEEQGQIEENAIQIARASLSAHTERQKETPMEESPVRIPANQRLGISHHHRSASAERITADSRITSQERLPASLRLGVALPSQMDNQEKSNSPQIPTSEERVPASLRLSRGRNPPSDSGVDSDPKTNKDLAEDERIPVALRLGPVFPSLLNKETEAEPSTAKKRLGRPPGRKNQVKEGPPAKPMTKKRKVTQTKGSPARRRAAATSTTAGQSRHKAGPSRGRDHTSSTTSSENQPICNMIPATVKKRMDFRIPSTLGP